MPKIKPPHSHSRRRRPAIDDTPVEEVSVSSVLFGIVMLVAIIVTTAAWMGGSLSDVNKRVDQAITDGSHLLGLSVESVEIIGLEQNPALADEVRAMALVEPGQHMFGADPHMIKRRVEATRKVLDVKVHRLWPNQIVIFAQAAEPVALWHDGREWTVVDGLGRVLPDAHAEDHPSLLRLAGAGAPDAAPDLVKALNKTPDLARTVAIATRVADRRWDMRLISGATVRLPEDESLPHALARLDGLEARTQLSQRPIRQIDLRNEGRVYLTPDGAAPRPAPSSAS